jgi:hypothetical protein
MRNGLKSAIDDVSPCVEPASNVYRIFWRGTRVANFETVTLALGYVGIFSHLTFAIKDNHGPVSERALRDRAVAMLQNLGCEVWSDPAARYTLPAVAPHRCSLKSHALHASKLSHSRARQWCSELL